VERPGVRQEDTSSFFAHEESVMSYEPKSGELVLITHHQGWRVNKDLLGICLGSSADVDEVMIDVLSDDGSVLRVPKFRVLPVQ
jgi:hypothetical protein